MLPGKEKKSKYLPESRGKMKQVMFKFCILKVSFFLVTSPISQAGEKNSVMHFMGKAIIFPFQGTWKVPFQPLRAAHNQIRRVTH